MPDTTKNSNSVFSGNIYLFHSFDVGDDIQLDAIERSGVLKTIPLSLSKYFKSYHIPLVVEHPDPHSSPQCVSCKIHNFGAVSFAYKIPFNDTLDQVRKNIYALDNIYYEQSLNDIKVVFKLIKQYITKASFFQTRSSYVVIQVNPQPDQLTITKLKEMYGGTIASLLRFETETLSEYQKDEILDAAIGYFRGDLIIIDTHATFLYDAEYTELLDFFEFANIQQLELRYFDRVLDQQLNAIYEGRARKIPLRSYLPFIGVLTSDPVGGLGKLKADISVIIERLEGSIKLAGEPYYSELYAILIDKLGIRGWNDSIDRKFEIIKDMQQVFQHRMDAIREDSISILISILILIEIIIGLL
jgi:hypothetical protein